MGQVARAGAWLFVAAAGVVMTSQAFGWTGTRLIAVAQSLTPYGIVLLAPIALVAARSGQHRLGLTASAIGIAGVLLASPVILASGPRPASDAAIGVRVASVNLLYSNTEITAAADALVAEDADVIAFSEYTAEHQRALTRHPLADRYPFRVDRAGLRAGGAAVWSRYPLLETRNLATTNYSLDVVVDGPDGELTIVAVHPPAPVFDFGAWKHDFGLIRERAAAVSSPTLIVGDFNASFWHPLFRDLLDTGFVDAHIAHGRGLSPSWPAGDWRPAFVRLDHALTGGGLVSTSIHDFDVPGSDHRGLVVTVAPAR